jgi:hypothetical protein
MLPSFDTAHTIYSSLEQFKDKVLLHSTNRSSTALKNASFPPTIEIQNFH